MTASKYAFYDIGRACLRGKTNHARSPSSSPASQAVFETNTNKKLIISSFEDIFSGPTKTATRSSRRDLSHRLHMKTIAGVRVPSRPSEPGDKDCCMSGCVNCVWELFNADLDDWKYKRKQAVEALTKQPPTKEMWPSDWEAPPKYLSIEYVPKEYIGVTSKGDRKVVVEEEPQMPVGMAVFTALERKLRARRKLSEQPQSPQRGADTRFLQA